MTVVIVITQKVNEALKARLTPEGRQALTQAIARGATVSVLHPAQIKEAILSSLQNGHPVIALVSEGQAAADFQRDIEETIREGMRNVSVFRVVTTPVPHSPDVSCENIIDITEVPTRIADAIAAFVKMMEEERSREVSDVDKPPEAVSQDEGKEKQEETEKKMDSVGDEGVGGEEKSRPAWQQKLFGKTAKKDKEASNVQERRPSVLHPPSSSQGSEQQVPPPLPPAPSWQRKRAVVLRYPEIFVCALDREISEAQEILARKYGLPVRLVKLHLHQIPMAGVSADQILAVVTERNVEEVRGSATFILAEDLTPEHAARYLPETSRIVASFVSRKRIPDAIAKAAVSLLVKEINLESL